MLFYAIVYLMDVHEGALFFIWCYLSCLFNIFIFLSLNPSIALFPETQYACLSQARSYVHIFRLLHICWVQPLVAQTPSLGVLEGFRRHVATQLYGTVRVLVQQVGQ